MKKIVEGVLFEAYNRMGCPALFIGLPESESLNFLLEDYREKYVKLYIKPVRVATRSEKKKAKKILFETMEGSEKK